MDVLLDGEAADIGDDGLAEDLPQLGQLMGDDMLHTGILQTHAVEHAVGALGDTGGGIAVAALRRGALEGQAAEQVNIVVGRELLTKAEGAAGRNHRIIQPHARKGNG